MRGKKVLSPMAGRDSQCQHSASRGAAGLELIMDCQDCGAGTLVNRTCYRGALEAICQHGSPGTIILRSHIERRYGTRSTRVLSSLAEIINIADDLQGQFRSESTKKERCRDCLAPLSSRLESLRGNIMSRNLKRALDDIPMLVQHRFKEGVRCHECAGMIRLQIDSISRLGSELQSEILAGAFKIVGVEE